MSVVRIMVASFSNSQDLILHSWLRHRNRVIEGRLIAGSSMDSAFNPGIGAAWKSIEPKDFGQEFDADRVFAWRLLTSNNRELARSAGLFFRFSDAQTDAADAQASVAKMEFDAVVDGSEGTQTWRGNLAGRPMVFGSRWFRMERDRERALQNALAILPMAHLAETAQSVGSSK